MSYRRPFPSTWWLRRRPYFMFVVRELTSVAVASYCAFLLYLVYRLGQGAEAYSAALELLMSPLSIALHVIGLALVLYHTFTWFNVTPKILIFYIGAQRIPGAFVVGAHYAGWLTTSALIVWVVLAM